MHAVIQDEVDEGDDLYSRNPIEQVSHCKDDMDIPQGLGLSDVS